MRSRSAIAGLALGVMGALALPSTAAAAPVDHPTNGSAYEVVHTDTTIDWNEANTAAESSTYQGVAGRLVSITSAEEQAFVEGLLDSPAVAEAAFIGLTDAVIENDFRWTSGEPTDYTNWAEFEPNDFNDEDCTVMHGPNLPQVGKWNDVPCTASGLSYYSAYVIEYVIDEDGDGIPDTDPPATKGECKKGGWASFNNPSFTNQGRCVSWVNHNT